jgi:photosystem II stability/assembly factor-like uncharacterized protein
MLKAILLLLLSVTACAQNIDILNSGSKTSLRGITVVDSHTAWAGGEKGTILRTTDGGATWENVGPRNADDLDFRDVEAFDANVAYAMASGPGTKSRIFKTTDGGKTWRQQFITFDPKNFFDCFAFWNRDHGIAIGDPIGRHFELLQTHDGGEHWSIITSLPEIMPNEAAYATGTCIVTAGKDDVWFGTGSKQGSRVFHSADHGSTWSTVATPVNADVTGTGIFSMAFADSQTGIIVGGNYLKPEEVRVNAATTSNGGQTWTATSQQPFGYRCGVAFMPGSGGNTIIAVGTNGVDLTEDRGGHWRSLSPERYHSVAFAPDGSAAFILGQNGRIARINFKTQANKR